MKHCAWPDLLKWGGEELARAGIETAKIEAELLLSHCSGIAKEKLFFDKPALNRSRTKLFRRCVRKRASRRPLQYILKSAEFMGLRLRMRDPVFIPRWETELLVEKALDALADIGSRRANVLEVGTGSGNIAISLTKSIADCKIIASDISDAALRIASWNAKKNFAAGNIRFVKSDVFDGIDKYYLNYFDIIISNPPYIKRNELGRLQPEVLHEDVRAIDGGEDGLDFYNRILKDGRLYLKEGGIFAFEIGYGQSDAIAKIAGGCADLSGFQVFKDYNGYDRVVLVRKNKHGAQKWIS